MFETIYSLAVKENGFINELQTDHQAEGRAYTILVKPSNFRVGVLFLKGKPLLVWEEDLHKVVKSVIGELETDENTLIAMILGQISPSQAIFHRKVTFKVKQGYPWYKFLTIVVQTVQAWLHVLEPLRG